MLSRRAALTLLIGFCSLTWLSLRPVATQPPAASPIRGSHGLVSCDSEHASRVGIEIMQKGGNAVDATVAVALALAVTHPTAGNIGGGGFMLIRLADGKAVAMDYREVAPLAASRNMYLDAKGNLIPNASLRGYRAVGVPGTVAGLALALQKYGSLSWKEVVEPARKLAADGFPVSHALANDLRTDRNLSRYPETRRIFQRDGKFYAEGELLKQPDLAATLERLRDNGPREFYEGETARRIADDMKAHDGLITLEDLKTYRAVEREPLRGTYRGHEILAMPPPSSGGIALLQMLHILERYDIAKLGANGSAKAHVLIEAMRRAFADRAEFLGDPDFTKIPVAALLSRKYADERAKTIDLERATPSSQIRHGQPAATESTQTTHFSIVDAQGNAVSNTYTLNFGYGSGVTARGTGILLNNEMDDFAAKPGAPNGFGLVQGEANAIAPRKRPLSSMTPTIVLKEGKLFAIVGSPGGPTIINTVLQILINLIDHQMNIRQAIEAPRLHHQWLPDEVRHEPFALAPDVKTALKAKGHLLASRPGVMGIAHGIVIDLKTTIRTGWADPRWPDGRAFGY